LSLGNNKILSILYRFGGSSKHSKNKMLLPCVFLTLTGKYNLKTTFKTSVI
jgi:hypothetical protein